MFFNVLKICGKVFRTPCCQDIFEDFLENFSENFLDRFKKTSCQDIFKKFCNVLQKPPPSGWGLTCGESVP